MTEHSEIGPSRWERARVRGMRHRGRQPGLLRLRRVPGVGTDDSAHGSARFRPRRVPATGAGGNPRLDAADAARPRRPRPPGRSGVGLGGARKPKIAIDAADTAAHCPVTVTPERTTVPVGASAAAFVRVGVPYPLLFARPVDHRLTVTHQASGVESGQEPSRVTFQQRPWLPWWMPPAVGLLAAFITVVLMLRHDEAPNLTGRTVPNATSCSTSTTSRSVARPTDSVEGHRCRTRSSPRCPNRARKSSATPWTSPSPRRRSVDSSRR